MFLQRGKRRGKKARDENVLLLRKEERLQENEDEAKIWAYRNILR